MIDFIKREPVRAFNVIKAIVVLVVAFGLQLTQEQQAALLVLAATIVGIGEYERAQVRPEATIPDDLKPIIEEHAAKERARRERV